MPYALIRKLPVEVSNVNQSNLTRNFLFTLTKYVLFGFEDTRLVRKEVQLDFKSVQNGSKSVHFDVKVVYIINITKMHISISHLARTHFGTYKKPML